MVGWRSGMLVIDEAHYIIHYQSPGSPVAYYQQVGRTGRALTELWGILLRGSENTAIWEMESGMVLNS